MKTYPSLPGFKTGFADHEGESCLAFEKYDGSNIRAEWSRKRGWYKFGTRREMFDERNPFWGNAISIFHETIAEPINRVIRENKNYKGAESVMVFMEYQGPNSFAGQHVPEDPKELVLFDVNVHKRGFVSPSQFVTDFGHINPSARVVYEGDLTLDFANRVKKGEIPCGIEGVVCKGGSGHKLWMVKLKLQSWIDRIKASYPQNWADFHDVTDEVV